MVAVPVARKLSKYTTLQCMFGCEEKGALFHAYVINCWDDAVQMRVSNAALSNFALEALAGYAF